MQPPCFDVCPTWLDLCCKIEEGLAALFTCFEHSTLFENRHILGNNIISKKKRMKKTSRLVIETGAIFALN